MNARSISFGMTGKRSKYGAVRTERDGTMFHSKGEAGRYSELKLLQAHGAIRNLELQPPFKIVVNGVKIGTCKADFRYEVKRDGEWVSIVEDYKGCDTAFMKWKRTLVLALYGVRIELVRGR